MGYRTVKTREYPFVSCQRTPLQRHHAATVLAPFVVILAPFVVILCEALIKFNSQKVDGEICIVLHLVVLTRCRRMTDGRKNRRTTDGAARS